MKKRALLTGLICAIFLITTSGQIFAKSTDGIILLNVQADEAVGDDDYGMSLIPAQHLKNGRSINVAGNGEQLSLSKDKNGNFKNDGLFQSETIKTDQDFNAIFFAHNSQLPEGTVLIFFVRTLINGVAGPWKVVALESGVVFDQTASAYQYQVRLGTDNTDVTPQVNGLHIEFANINRDANKNFDSSTNTPNSNAQFSGPSTIIERAQWGAKPPSEGYLYS